MSHAQEHENLIDGPYVLYQGDTILVKETKLSTDGKTTVYSHSIHKSERKNLLLNIRFSNDSTKNFKVRLRDQIANEMSIWEQPKKMFVISDVEGEFDAFRNLLLANKVINEKYEWIFGTGHLVLCGDLFDRGMDVTATLWLLYKLEDQAREKGGYVHTILGNHDMMNMAGDLRYLEKKYLKNAEAMGLSYLDLFTENTELGRWLRSKNLIEKIGENLCLHAGISVEIAKMGLDVEQLNKISRPYYGWKNLKNAVSNDTIRSIYSGTIGLFWYRGYFVEPLIEESAIDHILRQFEAKRIIVGHTILKGNVAFHFKGKVLAVDVNQHKGDHQAVLYTYKKWYKLNLTGNKTLLK
ncbi:metallophosphoesterase [Pedobacter frigoris]|uniref:metallophosphoesterase n=1 Tax=Pedobacter frigoris TaxID=2571272 RepID=UPI00292CF535|nr:metallophosphoesterase [Pedobacter frigoris]